MIYGIQAATFLVRYSLCRTLCVPVCRLPGWLWSWEEGEGRSEAPSLLSAADKTQMMGADTQLQCMDSSCSWGQLRCFSEVSLNVNSIRASVSMVTCAKLMDCVCEQKWCMLGLGNKGLIAHNRKFIFNWAKVIQGKTRKLKGSIKTLCKDSPKSHYLNSTKKKIFPFTHRQPFRFFLSVLFLIQSAIITTF